MDTATFGAGCFWGVEAEFRKLPGVKATAVGFEGGALENPSYKDVCYRDTGHAEVVQVAFDPTEISYEELLSVFWENHNPTTLNRQGPDVGSQYRSVIFTHSDEQANIAHKSRAEFDAAGKYSTPAVTQILPAETFYIAEEYHQQYLEKRGLASCHL